MALQRNYNEGDYEITQYTGGGSVRDRLTGKEVAHYFNYWCSEGVHPKTQEQIDHIKEKLGVELTITN